MAVTTDVPPELPQSRFHGTLAKLALVVVPSLTAAIVILKPYRWLVPRAVPVELPSPAAIVPLPCRAPSHPGGRDNPFTVTLDPLALRELPPDVWYRTIDSVMRTITDSLPCDINAEWNLLAAFQMVRTANRTMGPMLDLWVSREPGSANARLARAAYWTQQAWRARGSRFIRETPDSQITRMREHVARARADAETALRLDPRALVGYLLLLEHAQLRGDAEGAERIMIHATAAWPTSFTLRRSYLWTLQPRWGGSFQQMASFARQSQIDAGRNPALPSLLGFVAMEAGRAARANDDSVGSIARLDDAVGYGDYPRFRIERAISYRITGRYKEALADLDIALKTWPYDVEAHRERGSVLYEMGNRAQDADEVRSQLWSRALEEMQQSALLDPGDPITHQWLVFLTEKVGRTR